MPKPNLRFVSRMAVGHFMRLTALPVWLGIHWRYIYSEWHGNKKVMIKKTLFIIGSILLCTNVCATIVCTGIPDQVYAGAHGPSPSENSFWVGFQNDNGRYIIGGVSDDLAKARYSMLLTAMQSSSTIVMQYYHLNSPSTCENAIADKAAPSAMYIEK